MRKRIVAGVLALLVTFGSISFPQKVQAETATEENAATETGDSEGIEETGTENAVETESTGEPDYGETESTGELDTEGTETVIEETGTETEAEEPETEPMTEEAETEELETTVEDLEAETETEEAAEEPETEIGEITEPTEETEEEDFIAEMPNAIMLMSANTGDVTRAEWLSNLVSTFEMYVEDDIYPDNYFSDLDSSADYYYDVLVAVDFGVVEIEAGGEIRPDDAATREFAAYTLNYCLGFYNEDASYSFSDTSACSYPQDDQIAIDRGWFTLVDGAFEPEQPITTAEMNAMLSDAATIYASTAINENYDSSYVFADYVVEVPYGTEVSIDENDIVTITGLTRNISVGDTFVVYPTELPCLYMAASVETNGENTVITTSEADEASAIVSIDAEGTAAIDLSQFEEAEGVTAQYVTSEAQAQMLSAARGISVTKDSVLASKEITLSNGVKATITCNLTDLALNHNIDSANNSYYVSVSGTSTISGTVSIDAVAASGASSSITLGSVRVAGIGKVTISADLTLAGKIVATYTGGFEAGVQYSSSNGFRLVKSFTKKSFTTAAEADAKIGLKADFGVNMLLAKASIYATTGIQAKFISNSYNDGNTPNNCTNISAWLYARVGASATFGVGSLSKSFSKDLDIFTAENSPIYISYHYEDGKQVYSCARGSKNSQGGNYFYYTGANSYYGYSSYCGGSSKGVDSNGNEYVIYTFEVDGRNATITGYKGNASVMVIPETLDGYTVTAIGNSAFQNNTRLAAVVIPDSVTSIGSSAFSGCTALQNVTLSKNLLELGSSAFGNCVEITAIEIPKSIDMSNVGWFSGNEGPFAYCENLKSVSFEKGITRIANSLFAKCDGIEQIEIPDTVTEIGARAFCECANLKVVTLGNNVVKIDEGAFSEDTGITEIVMPDSIITVEANAFYNCSNLKDVKLSKNIEGLGWRTFGNCVGITAIEIPKSIDMSNVGWFSGNEGPFAYCENLKNVSFEKGITRIANSLFAKCDGIEQIEIPDTVTEIGARAFCECANLKVVTLGDNVVKIDEGAFSEDTGITEIVMPDSVITVEANAFYNCSNLKDVKLSKNIEGLGWRTFGNCVGITAIEIPKSIDMSNVGWFSGNEGPFAYCENLKSVSFEKGITRIANSLFAKCDGIEQIEIPDTVTEIGARAFCECKNLKDITIYNDVVKIGDRVFLDCTSLTQAILPDTVDSMGTYVFSGCTALQKVHLPSGRVNVPDGTFKNCKKLTEVNFPSTLQYIRSDAFYGCESLPEAVLPSGMLGIEQNAFYGCKALKKVVIPDTVTNLEDRIFYGCEGLSDVSLGTGITSIPDSTFYGCAALSEIVISYNVTTIGDSAFVNCVNLTSVTIPRNTTSIASNAFSYPKKMTIYGIAGTYAEQYAKEKGITFVHKEVKATAVSLNKTSLTLENGSSEVLAFTVTPKNFTDVVTWKSSNTDVVTVTDAGEVEAVGGGIATVRLTVGSVSADCTVTVNQPVEWLDLSEYDLELDVFETAQLSVTVYPSDATNKAVTWSSSNPNVATVNANGLVTAKAKGTATIKATAKDGSGEWDSCEVTVRNKEVTAISINQSNLELEESKTAQLSVTVYPSDATNKAVTWSSSNSSVATVDANGLVTAKAKGTATIKATAKDGSGAWDSCSVTVVKKIVQTKNISSCTATLKTTSYTYNGKERKPGVTVKDGSKTLTKDTDYTVSYAKNINKGTAEVTIKGKGNYTGSKKLTFTINAKKISDVKVSGIADQYYTGKAIKPGVTVKDGSVKLVKDTDYTLSYSDNKKTGTATVTMKGKGNYTGSKKVTFKIVKKVSTVKASSAGYNSVKVSWSSIKGVSGYKIYRSTSKNGKYSLVKTIKEWDTTSYKDTKLTTGKTYYYKVTPYKSSKNGTASKIVSAKPVPATPKISSVKNSAAKTATVKWEKVSGASGYEVYRATSKDGKYSKVKTIGSGKTISYKNTKLSKGKNYYYKVRAYRTANGKKIYGSYSSVKSVKISK